MPKHQKFRLGVKRNLYVCDTLFLRRTKSVGDSIPGAPDLDCLVTWRQLKVLPILTKIRQDDIVPGVSC